MSEMKETAFICNHASDKSLILMDELGRATNNEDGVAIAWSVSEYLIKTGAMTFFVTHYPQLSQLANIYPTVQNVCLEAEIKKGEISEILYTHKVRAGSCSVSTSYGVEMAAACGWSAEVVNDARDVENEVSKLLPYDGLCHPELTEQNNSRNRAFELLGDTLKKLRTLVNADRAQSYDSVRAELSAIQRQLLDTTDADISTAIDQLLQTGATTVDARKNSSMKSRIQPGSIRNIDNTYNGQKVETEADNREKFSEFEVDNNQSESDRSDGESTISSSTVSSDETSSDDTFRSHNYAKLK